MRRYKLLIAYDGTQYFGWQTQLNRPSIQREIQKVLSKINQTETTLVGSGRTDKGAHALGQVAHFDAKEIDDLQTYLFSLNSLLPKDIRILKISKASSDFHARFSTIGKVYHYYICTKQVLPPFQRQTYLHVKKPIRLDLMRKGAKFFLGEHDFTSFANLGSNAKSMKKTLKRLDIIPTKIGLRIELEADGFLYKMVRNIVGSLLELNRGKLSLEEIPKILQAKDRRYASQCAPAKALFLVQVHYFSQKSAPLFSEKTELWLQKS